MTPERYRQIKAILQAALELDRRMPHEDKKQPEAMRRKLEAAAK